MKGTERVIVLVAVGLCALIVAGYYQPFEVHSVYGGISRTEYCSLRWWWTPDCKNRFYAMILEIIAVAAFAAAGRAYVNRSGSAR